MKQFIIFSMLSIALVLSSCTMNHRPKAHSIEVETTTQETPKLTPVMAATELISVKQTNIELDMLDSVFKTIPDEIIIFICNNDNLDLDTVDSYSLTRLYLSKKDYYDNIVDKYKKIEKFKGHDKVFKPDSIPTKAKPDSTIR